MVAHVIVVCLVLCLFVCFFFFKQKTAYEMRISDWSSDVCSSDLGAQVGAMGQQMAGKGMAQHMGRNLRRADAGGHCEVFQQLAEPQIGRASCRERVCQYV